MIDHAERAKQLFMEGYNCAQAVFCAFNDMTGLDMDTAARISCSFGGGIGRLREVCGSVSGAVMALGMIKGYSDPKDPEAKKDHYHLIQKYARIYTGENGSIICRELLEGREVTPGSDPEARTPEYYKKRPCPDLVWYAARLCDMIINDEI